MRKKVLCCMIVITGLFLISIGGYAKENPNYGNVVEKLQYYYDGYVQCQPSYNENGQHAARGHFTFNNGKEGKVIKYTEWGNGFDDKRIISTSYRYKDTLNPIAPKVTFSYGFNYAKHNGSWPVGFGGDKE